MKANSMFTFVVAIICATFIFAGFGYYKLAELGQTTATEVVKLKDEVIELKIELRSFESKVNDLNSTDSVTIKSVEGIDKRLKNAEYRISKVTKDISELF